MILRDIEGEEFLLVDTKAQAETIARAIETCTRTAFVDEVGAGCCLPEGCRVLLDEECQNKESAANIVREIHNDWLRVRMRPYGTCREPWVDAFTKKLRDKTVEELEVELTKPEILDRMLLCLWDAFFLKQSERWSNAGVSNLRADETPEIARWFLRGRDVGAKPIFDGICAMCGTLLHSAIDHRSALSDKTSGPPLDRDGTVLRYPDGTPIVDAQPPFLLRYSPSLFAQEAPAVFRHDPETNRLSLQEGARPPWLKRDHAQANGSKPWLYCVECRDRYFMSGKKQRGHVPYRDKASQALMKRMHEREVASQDPEVESQGHGTLQDPELEPPEEDALPVHDFPDVQNVDEVADDPAGDEVADEGEEKLTVDVEKQVANC